MKIPAPSSSFSSSSSSSSSNSGGREGMGSRTTTRTRTTTILTFVLGSVLLVSAAEKFSLPPETASFKTGPGVELALAQCLLCHSADYVSTQPPLARPAWKATVQKMRDKYGAPLPEDQIEAVVNYLVKTYGAEARKP